MLRDKTHALLEALFTAFRKKALTPGQAIGGSIIVLEEARKKAAESVEPIRRLTSDLESVVLPYLIKRTRELEERGRKPQLSDDLRLLQQAIEERLNDAAALKGLIEGNRDVLERRLLGLEVLVESLRLEKDTLGEDQNPVILPRVGESLLRILE